MNFVIDKTEAPDTSLKSSTLVNGRKIQIQNWYLILQGHKLEERLKEKYPQLNRFQKEADLKIEIVETIVDDIPTILSQDFVDLFKSIQNYNQN